LKEVRPSFANSKVLNIILRRSKALMPSLYTGA